MDIVDLPMDRLTEAPWNPNGMDEPMLSRLEESIARYGLVAPLVVRPEGEWFEVLSGNQRLGVLAALGQETAPCVVVDVDDGHARLLAQALNRVHGEDDLSLKAELIRTVLEHLPESAVLSVLPENAASLEALSSLGEAQVAQHLEAWQAAQAARLRHLTFQLVEGQRNLVERAIDRALGAVEPDADGNPNRRGLALFAICREWLGEGMA